MAEPLAVTFGEPAGIGPDVTLAAFGRRAELGLPPFYVLADPVFLRRRAAAMGLAVDIETTVAPAHAMAVFDRALPVYDIGLPVTTAAGRPDEAGTRAALASLEHGVSHVLGGLARAVVTNPIAKAIAYRVGLTAPGHTEYLAERARAAGLAAEPVMMLWSAQLAVVPVTIHVPLAQVPALLTSERIVRTAHVVAEAMATRFGIARPRIAVAGLNPHAGEGGMLGAEETTVIAPAVAQLRAEGIDARGPLAADAMFYPEARARYDVALMMYHDQALIPIKTIAFDEAVNVTLGLPFVRTSPDHGTAFDLAGSGRASPSSFAAACRLAARLAPDP